MPNKHNLNILFIIFIICIVATISSNCACCVTNPGYHFEAQKPNLSDSFMVYNISISDTETELQGNLGGQSIKVDNEKDAIMIADQYLKSNNLLPVDSGQAYAIREDNTSRWANGTPISTPDYYWIVSYERIINGINVEGWNHLLVNVEKDGNVTRFREVWGNVSPYQEEKFKSIDQAFSELASHNSSAIIMIPKTIPQRVVVKNVSLAYYAEYPRDQKPTYVVPIYIFTGDQIDTEVSPNNVDYTAYVRAV